MKKLTEESLRRSLDTLLKNVESFGGNERKIVVHDRYYHLVVDEFDLLKKYELQLNCTKPRSYAKLVHKL